MSAIPVLDRRLGQPGWLALSCLAALLVGAVVGIAGPLPVVALTVGIVTLLGVVGAPGVMLGAYLLIPYYKGALQPYVPIDLTVLLALANASQVLFLVFDRRPRRVDAVSLAMWLGLGFLVLAGVLYAPDQSLAFSKAMGYWALVVMPIVPAAVRVGTDRRYLSQLLWAIFAMGVLTVILGVAELSVSSRLTVLGMNTIQVARAALLAPVVGIGYIIAQRRSWASAVTIISVPAALIVAIASGSRGPLVMVAVLAIAGVVRYFSAARIGKWRVALAGTGLVLLVATVLMVVGPSLPALSLARFTSLVAFVQGSPGGYSVAGGETSAAARVVLFQFAIQLWSQHPLVGVGTSGFQALSGPALGAAADVYPHNAMLQIAAELGLLGLAIFVPLVAIALFRRFPQGPAASTIRLLVAFHLLNAMVSGDIFTDRETLGLLLLALVVATAPALAANHDTAAERTDGLHGQSDPDHLACRAVARPEHSAKGRPHPSPDLREAPQA